jgi:hypothetical protein
MPVGVIGRMVRDGPSVELNVTVSVTTAVLAESEPEPVAGEPSVDELETVPFLGRSLKLALMLAELGEVTLPVGRMLGAPPQLPVPYA